jgi:hypothetical protein
MDIRGRAESLVSRLTANELSEARYIQRMLRKNGTVRALGISVAQNLDNKLRLKRFEVAFQAAFQADKDQLSSLLRLFHETEFQSCISVLTWYKTFREKVWMPFRNTSGVFRVLYSQAVQFDDGERDLVRAARTWNELTDASVFYGSNDDSNDDSNGNENWILAHRVPNEEFLSVWIKIAVRGGGDDDVLIISPEADAIIRGDRFRCLRIRKAMKQPLHLVTRNIRELRPPATRRPPPAVRRGSDILWGDADLKDPTTGRKIPRHKAFYHYQDVLPNGSVKQVYAYDSIPGERRLQNFRRVTGTREMPNPRSAREAVLTELTFLPPGGSTGKISPFQGGVKYLEALKRFQSISR